MLAEMADVQHVFLSIRVIFDDLTCKVTVNGHGDVSAVGVRVSLLVMQLRGQFSVANPHSHS